MLNSKFSYVNASCPILYRQRKDLRVPEAEDSEEEFEDEDDRGRGVLRSLSSEHEDDDTKEDATLDIDSGKMCDVSTGALQWICF